MTDLMKNEPHVMINSDSRRILKHYATGPAAKAAITRLTKKHLKRKTKMPDVEIMPYAKYEISTPKTRVVQSLMTGKDVVIDFNSSIGCDPSSETYWSM